MYHKILINRTTRTVRFFFDYLLQKFSLLWIDYAPNNDEFPDDDIGPNQHVQAGQLAATTNSVGGVSDDEPGAPGGEVRIETMHVLRYPFFPTFRPPPPSI